MIRYELGLLVLLLAASCDANAPRPLDAGADSNAHDAETDADAAIVLGNGIYRGVCDGSATERLDDDYFFSLNDESQTWRVFRASAQGTAVKSGQFGPQVGVTDEIDIEGSTRVGDRIYVTGSHGRDKNGNLEPGRFRFFALDIEGTAPEITVTVPGYTATLFQAMLEEDNYEHDDEALRTLLAERSNLTDPNDPNLAPTVNGVSIEALTVLPDGVTLAFGFRNPLEDGNAIVVTLENAAAVLTGATPQFGDIFTMDLGGLGLRSLTYDAERGYVWVIAGPTTGAAAPFALYRWTGVPGGAVELYQTLTPPNGAAAESLLPVLGTDQLRILFDESGSFFSPGLTCKDSSSAAKHFTESLVTVTAF